MTLDEAIGEVICEVRGGMTQTELANRLGEGWHQKTISLIESGKQPLHLRDLDRIAVILGRHPLKMIRDAYERLGRPE